MAFFAFRAKLYPLFAIVYGLFVAIFGLIYCRSLNCTYFLLGCYALFFVTGSWKACLKAIPGFVLVAGAFFLIFYYGKGSLESALAMSNRIAALFLGVIPGMSVEPIRFTRSLNQLHTPRFVALGMLIALSFVPLLGSESRRVREAMRTRGASSILNPKVFYRAFLFPFFLRIISLSDTLSLSIETRGFSLEKGKTSVFREEYPSLTDLFAGLLLIAGACLVGVL